MVDKGWVRSRNPSILTQQALQQQQVWLGQLSSALSFAVSNKLRVCMGGGDIYGKCQPGKKGS